MLFMNYAECPCCGRLTDDGAFFHVGKYTYLVCFDCDDSLSDQDIRDLIEKKIQERRALDGEL